MNKRTVIRVFAAFLLIAAALLAASAWSGFPWRKTFAPAAAAIKPVKSAAFELRLPNRSLFATIHEDGVELGPRTYGKADVADEGRGIFFLQGDTIRFSASDNTNPAANGRAYRIDYGWPHAGAAAAWLGLAGCALAAGLAVRVSHLRRALAAVKRWAGRERFRAFKKAPLATARRFVVRNGWLAVLAIPSLLLLAGMSPLWRDSDGVWQIAERPGVYTILHWPPLYTFGARVPLWLGTWFDHAFFRGSPPGADYFTRPHFSNSAICAVLIAQHLLLCCALAALIVVLSKRLTVRYGLAVFFSLNAFLYLFAQTIGSESLSNSLTIAFLAAAIVVYRQAQFRPGSWLACGALLVLGILTRHVNAVLAAVLPVAFIFEAILGGFRKKRDRSCWPRFACSLAMGFAAILLSTGVLRILCLANGIEYRSRQGYTFQFRLNFLTKLSAEDLRTLLADASARVSDEPLKQAIRSLDHGLLTDADSGESVLHERLLSNAERAGIRTRAARLAEVDRKLSVLERAFLFPPSRVMAAVILSDFWAGLRWTPADIAQTPVETTNFLISVRDQDRYRPIAKLAGLQHPLTKKNLPPWLTFYIDLWKWCPLWIFPIAALLAGVISLVRKRASEAARRSLAFGASLWLIGLGLTLLNCAMTFNLPRFWIPFLILMEVSILCVGLEAGGREPKILDARAARD